MRGIFNKKNIKYRRFFSQDVQNKKFNINNFNMFLIIIFNL